MLSVVILTKNSEATLERTLRSVSCFDDIIIIDDGSTDKTAKIASYYSVRFFSRDISHDFAAQRNFGLSQARYDWVLFVDSDEVVTDALQQEITSVLSEKHSYGAYRIKRRDYFWRQELCFGEVHRVREKGLIRLVHKKKGEWKGHVHEEFYTYAAPDPKCDYQMRHYPPYDSFASQTRLRWVYQSVGCLESFLDHYPHPSIHEFLISVNEYSTIRARELVSKGKRVSLFELLGYPWGKFFYTYVLKMGFRDKAPGFVYAFMMSFHSFLVRAKVIQYTELSYEL